MNGKLVQIKRSLGRWLWLGAARNLDLAKLRELTQGILTTRPDEIDCSECFDRLDRFAELIKAGESPSLAMPLVQDHVERCPDCRQEFLALMEALQADSDGKVQRILAPSPMP